MTFELGHCAACGSRDLDFRPALISPFLAAYVLGQAPRPCRIARCRACELLFWEPRLSEAEAQQLYAGYRGEDYFRVRHRQEFWYTRAVNQGLGGTEEMEIRRRTMLDTVARHRSLEHVGSVLDYGGDRGQILASGPGANRYVFDISGAEPVAGVSSLRSEAEMAGLRVDLLLLCHVLEHVSTPLDFLQRLKPCLAPGGLVFIEVPWEQFPLADIPERPWYRAYLARLARMSTMLRLVDFYSTAVRVKLRRIPPLGFAKMHEHLNYFGERSLRSLLEHSGFQVLECARLSRSGPVVALATPAEG
jgi:hypothetical protein